jgi:hypothetical protein
MTWLISLALGARNWLGIAADALKRFFAALSLQGWIGLIVAVVLIGTNVHWIGEARHWKKQSGQFEKLYRADQADFERIAKQATDQKNKLDAANAKISAALKERHNEEVARNAADANALRLSGPGKAACAGNPGSAAAPRGHVQAASAADAPLDQVPDPAGVQLIGVPFNDAVDFAQAYDDLLSEAKTWRDDDAQLRAAWPKSATPADAKPKSP